MTDSPEPFYAGKDASFVEIEFVKTQKQEELPKGVVIAKVLKISSKEDDEDELDTLNEQSKEISTLMEEVKNEIKVKQHDIDILLTHKANLQMEFERIAIRKMSIFWYAIVILSFVLMFQAYAHRAYFFVALNTYALMINYRALYITQTPHAFTVGFTIVLITFYVL